MSIRIRLLVMLCLTLFAVQSHARGELRIALTPDTGSANQVINPKPLIAYLEGRLNEGVSLVPIADTNSLVAAMAEGEVDLAWMDAYALLRLRRLDPASQALVRRPQDLAARSLIVSTRSDIRGLADLRGKRFTFVSADSTAGWLIPNLLFHQHDINPAEFFDQVGVAPHSDLALRWLLQGDSDAIVVDAGHWDRLKRSIRLAGRLHVIAESEAYVDHSWSVRGGLPARRIQTIRAALLALDPAHYRQRAVLKALEAERYVPAQPEQDPLVEQAQHLIGPLK